MEGPGRARARQVTAMKKECLYRYAMDGVGIYEAMKELVFRRYPFDYARKWWKKILDASSWLPKPMVDDYGKGLVSWFTDAGDKKFRETVLPLMLVDIVYEDLEFYKKPVSKLGKVVYRDEFQAVEDVSAKKGPDDAAQGR